MISDLPKDLASEVFSRIPLTSLRNFRLTCKNWNKLATDESFTKKHIDEAKAASEFTKVMVIDSRVYLVTLDLANASINCSSRLISLVKKDSDRVRISEVYHCDGLLLCVTKDFKRFAVWNPYTGQTRWFGPLHRYTKFFAIGYDKRKSYKVLRFMDSFYHNMSSYDIYELNSNSRKFFDVSFDWKIMNRARGVSLKGNTYWFARDNLIDPGDVDTGGFLICFDFTTERFGRLPLPFQSSDIDNVTLSSVREEQLAVLYKPRRDFRIKIWVTTTIKPQVVAWSKFLAVDIRPCAYFLYCITQASFFIEEEKKIVVVLYQNRHNRNVAYFFGEDEYFREVDLDLGNPAAKFPRGCSYVPSLVHIPQRDERKNSKRKR